jgi:hypothetical protein
VIVRNFEGGLKVLSDRISIGNSTIQSLLVGISIDPNDKRPELIGPKYDLVNVCVVSVNLPLSTYDALRSERIGGPGTGTLSQREYVVYDGQAR